MKKKRITKLEIEKPKKRIGHYNYQGSKTTFDNRPKKLRTRKNIKDKEIGEQECS